MSEATATIPAKRAAPSYTREAAGRILRRWGARIGLVWIILLLLLAVFAPFIATSHPLLMKQGGHWSSPVLGSLAPADVVLQAIFWAAVVLWLAPLETPKKVLIWSGVLVITSIAAIEWVHPPELTVYEKYRNGLHEGKIERVIMAPIPFSPLDHMNDEEDMRLKPPSPAHWMGTTDASADLMSNMIHATRIALSIGFIATGSAVLIGVLLGGLMGYFVGLTDLLGMRLAEIFDSIPTLLLLIIFAAVRKPNLYVMMLIIGLTNWVQYAYFVRAEFLSLRDRDFVHAARAGGIPLHSIIFRHMLLNGLTPVIVTASFGVASAILMESTLSFLGIGLADESSWGALLEEALGSGGTFFWWIALYPGMAIFLTVFAYNLIGEALRDALDPKLARMM
jgi:peptide/nickel transport system permease protein